MDLTEINGIREKTTVQLSRLGVGNVEELLELYPRKYITYPHPVTVSALQEGVRAVYGYIKNANFYNGGHGAVRINLRDDNGKTVTLTWFHMPYITKVLKPNIFYVFYGEVKRVDGRLYMTQPTHFQMEEYMKLVGDILPIYPLTKGITQEALRGYIKSALMEYELPVTIPEYLYQKYALLSHEDAIWNIHFPESMELREEARKTLAFEELYHFLYHVRLRNTKISENHYKIVHTGIRKHVESILPYLLTGSQRKTLDQIEKEISGDIAANRLIQADVGAGKTIVAFIIMLEVADNGVQAVLMAPTSILAKQHYEELVRICQAIKREDLLPVLVTGEMTAKERKSVYKEIQSGERRLVIGTHAVFQEKIRFCNLALVIVDEQHRFGVKQREALCEKGEHPHMISMSATPIPRTLGNILYGGMNISTMEEKPTDRLPIKNCVVDESYRTSIIQFISGEIRKGHQAYIVCPAVEENEETISVERYMYEIDKMFPDIPCAGMYGQMDASDKKDIMEAFTKGEIKILVCTTVIEVGMNVPNATVILIEHANHFGLLQLHQIRGRVGRGKDQAYCIFMNDSKEDNKRLDILKQTNNGFLIAEKDFQLRGGGELLGTKQSGDMGLKIADIYKDQKILEAAYESVKENFTI